MKSLDEVLTAIRRAGHDPRQGRLILHTSHGGLALRALEQGVKISLNPQQPMESVLFFPTPASVKQIIIPGDER